MCIITCRILEHIYLHLQPSPIIPSNFLASAQLFHARRLAQSSIGLHKDNRSLRHFLYYFASLLRSQILVEAALLLRLLIIPVARTFLSRAGSGDHDGIELDRYRSEIAWCADAAHRDRTDGRTLADRSPGRRSHAQPRRLPVG